MSQDKGWIKLHREIRDHWIFKEKRVFSKYEAWTDLIMDANHKDNKIMFNNCLVDIKRGQRITSEVQLAERWNWSRKKVRKFLELLENEGMIKKIVEPNRFIIVEIMNYDKYQNGTTDDTTQDIVNTYIEQCTVTTEGTTKEQLKNNIGTTKEQLKNTNKNEKNEKNDKKYIKYAEYVFMTEEEYQKLVGKHSEELVKKMIEKLDNYKGSTGKRYKSDYRAILSWVEDQVLKENKQLIKQNNKPTRFHNFEQRTAKYTPEQLEEIARKRREAGG